MAPGSVPDGTVGKRFLREIAGEWKGVWDRSWNSERPIVFMAVILRKEVEARRAGHIKRTIEDQPQQPGGGAIPRSDGRLTGIVTIEGTK